MKNLELMRTSNLNKKPLVIITTGDPRGIGPEITAKVLKNKSLSKTADFLTIGGLKTLPYCKISQRQAGRESFQNIKLALKIIRQTTRRKALVTAPISKEALKAYGQDYGGHTELLGDLTVSKDTTMMFCSKRFKVAIVTRHLPLKSVPKMITFDNILITGRHLAFALKKYFKVEKPRIAVAGLNPHAGEHGVLGKEESLVITPAIKILNKSNNFFYGPIPSDVLYHKLYEKEYDAGIFMYHDQALAAFKMLEFNQGVNLTIGLPFIRTSPDHGTAFDIAGKNKADPSSMREAVLLASKLAF